MKRNATVRFTYMSIPRTGKVIRVFDDGDIRVRADKSTRVERETKKDRDFILMASEVTELCPRCLAHPVTHQVAGKPCCMYCEDTLGSIQADAQEPRTETDYDRGPD